MAEQSNGWELKYTVGHADGTPLDPEAEYLVLRIDKDPAARQAAIVYGGMTELPELGEDVIARTMAYARLATFNLAVPVKVSPKMKAVRGISRRLVITEGQCPCVPEDQWTEDTMCPCKCLREMGECHCGLYVRAGGDL